MVGGRRLHAELLEDRRLLTVAALVDASSVLQVSIAGTDTAQVGVDATNHVVVKDSTNAIVFSGPVAGLVAGINVAPAGTNDIVDLTGVGASTEFTGLAAVNVSAAAGATTFLSGSITTSGPQLYAPNVLLTGDTVLSSTTGNIGFGGVIEANGSPHNLEIHSLGAVFSGNVGDAPGGELGLLTTNGTGISVINAPVIKAATLTFN
ncbi:MAG TPA: hypothetical protein VFU81_11525, partial [Thermomicrobiales bacterium]|nr:hypothetical protein [Thermomicrobiales bacterium]